MSETCPQCSSGLLYKDGLRYWRDGRIAQRWLCRNCGYRFSDSDVKLKVRCQLLKGSEPVNDLAHVVVANLDLSVKESSNDMSFLRREDSGVHGRTVLGQSLSGFRDCNSNRRVCVSENEAKNLTETTRQEEAQREGTPTKADVKGKVIAHLWWLRQEGYSESTILARSQILRYMEKKVDLTNPVAVREYIARRSSTPGRRANLIYAYALFAKWAGLPFTLPRINIPGKFPFIPAEREIDDLVAACTKYIATFLQLGKETGARAGEMGSLKWTDIDFENATLRVAAEKGSNPRVCKLSNKAIQMLNQLPRKHPTIFIGQYKNVINLRSTYCKQRKRVAAKMGNPRLLQIHFHTLRHWKATIEYHKTKDILHVMQVLGHKRIQNTLKYTQLVNFDNPDGYTCKVAKTQEELSALIEAGFEYVCECEGLQYFRKLK